MDAVIYEPPAMAEVGDFNQITLKQGTWGYDSRDQCLIAC
ncbi:lasso RiPP family leader peptide-containing protein [Actinomadura roseirufa]|nr:lasso RiPP family leader peptide-containing protein [Actinomadura roseirufa]